MAVVNSLHGQPEGGSEGLGGEKVFHSAMFPASSHMTALSIGVRYQILIDITKQLTCHAANLLQRMR